MMLNQLARMSKKKSFKTFCRVQLTLFQFWDEPNTTTTKQITVAPVLLSHVNDTNYSVSVVEGGRCLEPTLTCPDPLTNLNIEHYRSLTARKTSFKNATLQSKIFRI